MGSRGNVEPNARPLFALINQGAGRRAHRTLGALPGNVLSDAESEVLLGGIHLKAAWLLLLLHEVQNAAL